ncbi:MAG: DoxX family protein [Acidimicrobiales bacterium]|nr:DoxX family protein [Acidimicrobiales bacterium]
MIPLLAEATPAADWFDGASAGLLLIRVVVGVTLAAHGYNKFFGGGRIPGTAAWFDSMGMKPNGRLHAILAASTEMGAGLLFAVGFLTPLAAAGFVGLMVVAAWTVHRPNGFFIVKNGWEYNVILAVVPVGIAMVGPGKHSLDWALGLDFAFDPWLAFAISAVLGVAGGAGLLAACWRPPADQ